MTLNKFRPGTFTWAICPCCQGNGKVDNSAFSNGFTSSEWADMQSDYDDNETSLAEHYLSGAFDVACTECAGAGKVQVPIIGALTFGERRVLAEERRSMRVQAEYDDDSAAERRMGA